MRCPFRQLQIESVIRTKDSKREIAEAVRRADRIFKSPRLGIRKPLAFRRRIVPVR